MNSLNNGLLSVCLMMFLFIPSEEQFFSLYAKESNCQIKKPAELTVNYKSKVSKLKPTPLIQLVLPKQAVRTQVNMKRLLLEKYFLLNQKRKLKAIDNPDSKIKKYLQFIDNELYHIGSQIERVTKKPKVKRNLVNTDFINNIMLALI